jgi:hypothetical protein
VPFVLRYDQKESASKMVSSITAMGYLIMAVLYHWPFSGWAAQYRGLRQMYQTNREQALGKFGRHTFKRAALSRIGL